MSCHGWSIYCVHTSWEEAAPLIILLRISIFSADISHLPLYRYVCWWLIMIMMALLLRTRTITTTAVVIYCGHRRKNKNNFLLFAVHFLVISSSKHYLQMRGKREKLVKKGFSLTSYMSVRVCVRAFINILTKYKRPVSPCMIQCVKRA